MIAASTQSTASAGSSSGGVNENGPEIFIYEIPMSSRQRLCDHLDELNAWNQLAVIMSLKPGELQSIRRQQTLGNSPTDELLKIWGGQYNHTVTELFVVLKRQKLFQAMRILKDFVARKYHLLIPNSQPVLSELMAKDNSQGDTHSKKKLNCSSSSGISDTDNIDTSDNNYTTTNTSHSNNNGAANNNNNNISESQEQSNFLNPRNVAEYASSIPEINYIELTDATNNWSDQNILGKGGFGTVYRGYWKHTHFAIKQIHYRGPNGRENAKIQLQQSLNELKYLNSCRHDNILPLYGYSIRGEKPCLVYKLMTGRSLELRLNSKHLPPLNWTQRINICMGTSRGINYLHTFRDKPLIHGDIKPANVLLNECLQPKIGDFGLAREGPNSVNSAVEVTQVFGTKPYLPPEFLNSRRLSTQVDTYSFGVVLLETFTGMRAYDKNRSSNPLLTRYVLKLLATTPDYPLENLIDRNVPVQSIAEQEMCKHCIQLGIECIAENPQQRPDMERVLTTIHNCYAHFSQFLQPA